MTALPQEIHTFDLVVEGLSPDCPDAEFDALSSALVENGIEDAMLVTRAGRVLLSYERAAPSALVAYQLAVHELERAGVALRVVEVAHDDLVTCAEIAERRGLSPETVRLQSLGRRRCNAGPFPTPVRSAPVKLWHWPSVSAWYGDPLNDATPRAVDAMNAYLRLAAALAHGERFAHRPQLDAVLDALVQASVESLSLAGITPTVAVEEATDTEGRCGRSVALTLHSDSGSEHLPPAEIESADSLEFDTPVERKPRAPVGQKPRTMVMS